MTLKIPTTTSPVGDTVEIVRPMTVGDLAAHLRITPADVQRELMKLGILANLNAEVSVENATKVAQARGGPDHRHGGRAAERGLGGG